MSTAGPSVDPGARAPLRIGLSQRVAALPGRDERRDCLDQAWHDLLGDLGWLGVPLPNRPAQAVQLAQDLGLHGLIFTGGNDLAHLPGATDVAPERDATERALLAHALAVGLPVLGVCRGCQLLICDYGGALHRVDGHVRQDHALRPPPGRAHRLQLPAAFVTNSYHGWGATPDTLGSTLTVEALAEDGTVEAVSHPSLNVQGVLWHPERGDIDPHDRALLRRVFTPATR